MLEKLTYGEHETLFGPAYFLLTEQGLLYQCSFAPIALNQPTQVIQQAAYKTQPWADLVGKPCADAPLHLQGTVFQRQVWRAVQLIPFGETRSYQQIADDIQRPNAVRAVANAIARNPIGWFIPCHRVIRHNGDLGGFAWGSALKHTLLEHEKTALRNQYL